MRVRIDDVSFFDECDPSQTKTGHIIIRDERIEALLEGGSAEPAESFDEIIDGSSKLVLPGLINAHGHAAMTLFRGYADDLPLYTWLTEKIWPAEDMLTQDDVYIGTQLAMLEMIETGTTTFTDMYVHMDRVAEAVIESGMRAVIGRGLVGLGEDRDEKLAEAIALIKDFHGAGNGRITTTLAPHAPYTCPEDFLKQIIDQAASLDQSIQIHIAETTKEVADLQKSKGMTPIRFLDGMGLFDQRVTAAHCTFLTDDDIDLMAHKDVRVAHNPGSNLKLGSGVAPLAKMLQAGLKVGLGTDGAASNNKLDLFEEMRLVALLHKGVLQDPTAVPAHKAFLLATTGGADALFLNDVGTLTPGSLADLILVDISSPRYYPRHSLLSHAVYSSQAGDVTDVFVAGRHLYKNREFLTIDKERVVAEAERRSRKFYAARRG